MKIPSVSHFQRFEIKYPLDMRTADRIIVGLLDYMRWDTHCNSDNDYAYTVSSLYYDSLDYACYVEKKMGVRNRVKLRLRFYEEEYKKNTPIFLEIKRKRDMVVVKDRVRLTIREYQALLEEGRISSVIRNYSGSERKLIEEFFWIKKHNCLHPKLMVVYKRKALESSIGLNFRVTFDFGIITSPSKQLYLAFPRRVVDNIVIMEVKFNNVMPSWFHDIIQKYQLSRDSFSKYASSLESCPGYLLL
jgi:SPX domain protein involved in polyphosphate accumulation